MRELDVQHHILTSQRRAISPRTKMIIVNTPHNPVGKVFTKSELESIAKIAEEYNLLVMADEVVCRHYLPSRCVLEPLFISVRLSGF